MRSSLDEPVLFRQDAQLFLYALEPLSQRRRRGAERVRDVVPFELPVAVKERGDFCIAVFVSVRECVAVVTREPVRRPALLRTLAGR